MITVLRLGHRFSRDARISTHLALAARAFGANKMVYDAKASDVKESVDAITKSWGGDFIVEYTSSWRKCISSFDGVKVHLTMYGIPIGNVVPTLPREKDMLVVVGGAKVPSDVYGLVDFNVSVGGQPHSEVAALAVFLDRYYGGLGILKEFNGKKHIVPQARGKKVLETR